MKVSREQVAENRRKILAAAARLVRKRGFDAVTIDEVTNEAGLTRGAFYGHFKSKSDLMAQACGYAARREGKLEYPSLAYFCSEYLTRRHREKHGEGCVFAATGQEAVRQPIEIRHELTEGFKKRVEHLSRSAPGKTSKEKRSATITAYSTLVGALVLARMSDDPELSDELLSVNRDVLLSKLTRHSTNQFTLRDCL
jgi:TetR/AcrR family transcriptional repressor of nem operon